MDWKKIALSEPGAEGYGRMSRPIENLLSDAVARHGRKQMPTVVWIHDRLDEKKELAVQKMLVDEGLCLALKRFRCLKADVQSVPDEKAREKLIARAPMMLFYDPGGERLDMLTGRRATSRSGFCARVKKLWHQSYTLPLREYTRRMDNILDRLDHIERERRSLEAKMVRAEDNPAKLARLTREEAKLEEAKARVLADEKTIMEACRLREEFSSPGASED